LALSKNATWGERRQNSDEKESLPAMQVQ
jgi:hypothetical protein